MFASWAIAAGLPVISQIAVTSGTFAGAVVEDVRAPAAGLCGPGLRWRWMRSSPPPPRTFEDFQRTLDPRSQHGLSPEGPKASLDFLGLSFDRGAEIRTRDLLVPQTAQRVGGRCREVARSGSATSLPGIGPLS